MSAPIYVLLANVGGNFVSCEFTDRQKAIDMAKAKYLDGASPVEVFHYTNGGQNCETDYFQERETNA